MKFAIFDLDGTLVNSLADIAEATNYTMSELGLPRYELSEFNYMVGDGLKMLIERALPHDKQHLYDKAVELYNSYYGSHYTVKTKVYDGIPELLEGLRSRGVTLAVASNKTDYFTTDVISHYFGNEYFKIVQGKSEGRPVKPDPAIISVIMEKLHADKKDCYMIGDTKIDIQTGKNAGIKTIGCLWGFRTREELEAAGADLIAEKPSDIIDMII